MGLLRLAESRRQEGPGVGVTDQWLQWLEKDREKPVAFELQHFRCGVQWNPELIFPKKDVHGKMPLMIIAKVSS